MLSSSSNPDTNSHLVALIETCMSKDIPENMKAKKQKFSVKGNIKVEEY